MIETPRLLLRPHALHDFEPWHAMFSDPEARRFLAVAAPTREDGWNRLLRYAGHWSLLGFGLFAVLERATGRFVGEVGHADFHRDLGPRFDGVPEATWIFDPASHGHGYATEAAAAAQAWIDAHRGRPRTVCIINPANAPSLRVAERLGYRAFDTVTYKDKPYAMLERVP